MASTQAFGDQITQVSFTSKDRMVRELLSDYVPLSKYHRILWNAETLEINGKRETWVQYYGPARLNYFQWTTLTPTVPFAEGEIAYAVDPYSEKLVNEATEFISAQMGSKEPRQVRWAMFYLGKYKVKRGIPALLKYLHYHYTTVPVVEEAFPALRALIQIGNPAAGDALKALVTETDAQRLELLRRVILGVDGPGTGRKRIESIAASIKDTLQQQKIRSGLAKSLQGPVVSALPAT